MQLKLAYEYDGENREVKTNLFVIVAWERRFKRKASDLANGIGIEDLCYLAFEASKTAGLVVPANLDDFIKKLGNLEIVTDEPENPTQAAPTDDN
jgi:hypothetical protein